MDAWHTLVPSPYLRQRFEVAKELLCQVGSIFVQIGDENVHLVRDVLDSVFGQENFVVTVVVKKKSVTTVTEPIQDYVLWFAKDRKQMRSRRLTTARDLVDDDSRFKKVEFANGERRAITDCTGQELNTDGLRFLTDDYPMVSQEPSKGRKRSV